MVSLGICFHRKAEWRSDLDLIQIQVKTQENAAQSILINSEKSWKQLTIERWKIIMGEINLDWVLGGFAALIVIAGMWMLASGVTAMNDDQKKP